MSNPPIEESWDTMEDAGMVITDVGVLSKKEKAPQEWLVLSLSSIHRPRLGCMLGRVCCVAIMKCCHAQIENTHDGKKANFPEGRLGLTTRYICYTKKSASPQRVSVLYP